MISVANDPAQIVRRLWTYGTSSMAEVTNLNCHYSRMLGIPVQLVSTDAPLRWTL